jgi:hypothetical protein
VRRLQAWADPDAVFRAETGRGSGRISLCCMLALADELDSDGVRTELELAFGFEQTRAVLAFCCTPFSFIWKILIGTGSGSAEWHCGPRRFEAGNDDVAGKEVSLAWFRKFWAVHRYIGFGRIVATKIEGPILLDLV